MTSQSAKSSPPRRPVVLKLALLVLGAIALGGCGTETNDEVESGSTSTTEAKPTSTIVATSTAPSVPIPPTAEATNRVDNQTTVQPTTTSIAAPATNDGRVPDQDLPGEDLVLFAREGQPFSVVGVAYDDQLNIRATPASDAEVLVTAKPDAADLIATGRTRYNDDKVWNEVSVDGRVGWVALSYLAIKGFTDDASSEVVEIVGQTPRAATMEELGQQIASMYASEEPPSRITQSTPVAEGDPAEVSYDVMGLGDDGVAGFRLRVTASPDEAGRYALQSVERTVFCLRGITDDGLCP